MKIKVMITDDQRLMREGLKTLLDLEEDLNVVELAENGKDALEKLQSAEPDVILMDIRMPVMDGVECTKVIKQQYPRVKVIILTTFDDDEFIIEALKNGAVGYILKDLSSEKLVEVIKDAYKGNSIMQPEIAAKVISHITGAVKEASRNDINRVISKDSSEPSQHGNDEFNYSDNTKIMGHNVDENTVKNMSKMKDHISQLTDREREILHLVGDGMSNTEIAKKLYISVGTVKNYISNLYSKLEIDDRSKLTLYAIKTASKR